MKKMSTLSLNPSKVFISALVIAALVFFLFQGVAITTSPPISPPNENPDNGTNPDPLSIPEDHPVITCASAPKLSPVLMDSAGR